MGTRGSRARARGRVLQVESLESRQLLAATVGGVAPSVVVIRRSLADLQSQLRTGPLADLSSGAVNGDDFISEVQIVQADWKQGIDKKYLPRFRAINDLLTLQGQRIVANLVSLNEQAVAGMYDGNAQAMVSGAAINALTSGPIYSLNNPVSANIVTTQIFEENLAALARAMDPTNPNALTIEEVSLTLQAEAESYRADMYAALLLSHPGIADKIGGAINTLEATVLAIAADDSATAQSDVNQAIAAFDTTILGVSGIFSIRGPINRVNSARGFLPHNLSVKSAPTAVGDVSATANVGGLATLSATLTSRGRPVSNVVVSFTLQGAFAGTALTDQDGVATLSGVPISGSAGTVPGAVVATFPGNSRLRPSSSSGDLDVGQSASALTSVSGTSSFGGNAILKATLTTPESGAGVAGKTVQFTLNGASVGSATTDLNGVATLSGVANSDSVGTHTGVVGASFAGDSDFTSSTGTGDLVVSAAATTLNSVSGTATFGGTATLTATLNSSATGQPIPGATINFSLGGTAAGTAVTNASGVATLSGVANPFGAGTQTGSVSVSFAATTNYQASTGTGNLVVSKAATAVSAVSGNAVQGNAATLTATLKSSVTGQPVQGVTVSFSLSGTNAGTATTNSNGVATLTGVANSQPVGAYPGAIVASFGGNANYLNSSATGAFTVSAAGSTLTLVSGTSTFGGTATLTATLSSGGSLLAGKTVNFTLDGASVGSGVTDSNGVATLSGVAVSQAADTYIGIVAASFAGDTSYGASTASGDLTVSQAATSLTQVSANAVAGGTATLTAFLTSSVTGVGLPGKTVVFTLNSQQVGTATTNASGIATLTGVANSDPAGTYPGVVGASFAGDTNYVSSGGTGDLTVSAAASSLSGVSGAATFGGTATLTATLTSGGSGIAGATVSFILDGKAVGTAVTDGAGVATLSSVPTTDTPGTHTGVVLASFAGDPAHGASSASGDLVVSQAATLFSGVGGTSNFGGVESLTATLKSDVTGQPIVGRTVTFELNGLEVGTAVTDNNGVASFQTSTTSNDPVGTHTGAIEAVFSGDTDYLDSSAFGDLVVSKAASQLLTITGTAVYGGDATLKATLKSSASNQPIQGEPLSFTLNGSPVGSIVTDNDGVATLPEIPTTDTAGTHTGVVGVSYSGNASYLASSGTGDLVVNQAPTSLGSVSGSGSGASGGTVTLVATLTSNVTGQPIAGQTVSFLLGTNTTPVGSAVTDSDGVATLSGLSNAGLTNGEVVTARYTGGPNYVGAPDATGTLTLS